MTPSSYLADSMSRFDLPDDPPLPEVAPPQLEELTDAELGSLSGGLRRWLRRIEDVRRQRRAGGTSPPPESLSPSGLPARQR